MLPCLQLTNRLISPMQDKLPTLLCYFNRETSATHTRVAPSINPYQMQKILKKGTNISCAKKKTMFDATPPCAWRRPCCCVACQQQMPRPFRLASAVNIKCYDNFDWLRLSARNATPILIALPCYLQLSFAVDAGRRGAMKATCILQ